MALNLITSSAGSIASTASISDDLPAALLDWTTTASGCSSLRLVAAR